MLHVDRDDPEVAPLHQLAVDRGQPERLPIEGAGCGQVGDVDLDVVEHCVAHDHARCLGTAVAG